MCLLNLRIFFLVENKIFILIKKNNMKNKFACSYVLIESNTLTSLKIGKLEKN